MRRKRCLGLIMKEKVVAKGVEQRYYTVVHMFVMHFFALMACCGKTISAAESRRRKRMDKFGKYYTNYEPISTDARAREDLFALPGRSFVARDRIASLSNDFIRIENRVVAAAAAASYSFCSLCSCVNYYIISRGAIRVDSRVIR